MNPARLARPLRLAAYLLAGAGLLYLWTRFDAYQLPAEGCSPLLRFAPGDRLLLDRRPAPAREGDALLVRGEDGLLYLGRVTRLRRREGQREVWIETDSPTCPGRDSDEMGWIPSDRIAARVILVWPW